jgi:hypothetical protein
MELDDSIADLDAQSHSLRAIKLGQQAFDLRPCLPGSTGYGHTRGRWRWRTPQRGRARVMVRVVNIGIRIIIPNCTRSLEAEASSVVPLAPATPAKC